jgi:hypothetical protein
MKTNLKVLLIAAVLIIAASCGTKLSQSYYSQKPQIIGTELDGSYAISCWGTGRNSDEAMKEVQKQAVYEVVFNGVASASSNIQSLKPLILTVNAKDKYADWSNKFFADGGEYLKYCSKHDRRTGSSNFVKTGNQVKCQGVVSVDVAALKAALKESGIIK